MFTVSVYVGMHPTTSLGFSSKPVHDHILAMTIPFQMWMYRCFIACKPAIASLVLGWANCVKSLPFTTLQLYGLKIPTWCIKKTQKPTHKITYFQIQVSVWWKSLDCSEISIFPSFIPYVTEESRRQPGEILWILVKNLRPHEKLEKIFLGHKVHTQFYVHVNSFRLECLKVTLLYTGTITTWFS